MSTDTKAEWEARELARAKAHEILDAVFCEQLGDGVQHTQRCNKVTASELAHAVELAEVRRQRDVAMQALRDVAAIHRRYVTAAEGSADEGRAMDDFDDVCCNEVDRALQVGDRS